MRQPLILISFIFLLSNNIIAQNTNNWVTVLQLHNNEQLLLKVDNKLKLEISDNTLIVKSGESDTGISYCLSDIKGLNYAQIIDTTIPTIVSEPSLTLLPNSIEINSSEDHGFVKIIDIEGNVVFSSNYINSITIDISQYKQGIYLIFLNNKVSIKILKK